MNIVTGKRGVAHITSQQDRDANRGAFGEGSYVLNVGHKLSAEITGSNEVTLHDGVISHQGCIAEIAPGTTEAVTIANGTIGQERYDAIVARYTKDGNGIENMEVVVIQGTPADAGAEYPAITEGDIAAGDLVSDMLLYYVYVSEVTLYGPFKEFVVLKNIASIPEPVVLPTYTVQNKPGNSVNVTDGNDATLVNTGTLVPGTYIIKGKVQFAHNSSGRRAAYFSTTSTGGTANNAIVTAAPSPSYRTDLEVVMMVTLTANTTYYLRAFQNSGATLACTGNIQFLRIR